MLIVGFVAPFLVGCEGSASEPKPTYIIEVHGTEHALSYFDVTANGMAADPKLMFLGTLARVLRTTAPWSGVKDRTFTVTARDRGRIVATAKLEPFVCAQKRNLDERIRSGWHVTETHEVFLTDNGQIELNADFGYALSDTCELTAPGGKDGDGWSTVAYAERECSTDDRMMTGLRIMGRSGQATIDAALNACWAVLTDTDNGRIHMTLTATTSLGQVVLGLTHCLSSFSEPFPTTLTVRDDNACPTVGHVYRTLPDGDIESLGQTSGTWLINTADLARGGRIAGSVDLRTLSDSGDEVTISGTYDLPILRVPLEGDSQG
jgi:hypothetical protein